MADRDYYEVLGVSRDATADQIKKAYRALARKHHPDANPGDKTAESKFKEVQNAYDVLSEPEKRARFDQFGNAGPEGFNPRSGPQEWAARGGGPGGDPVDLSSFFGPSAGVAGAEGGGIFDEIFTRMRGEKQGRRPGPLRREVAEASLTIPFLTAVKGGKTAVELDREHGNREVKEIAIPAGVESGAKLRLKGQGDPSGQHDLIITVTVDPHPYFTRAGRDLSVEVPITIAEAVLGAKVEVPTLDGFKTMPIPAGSSTGQRLRLRGKGIAASQTLPEGDLYVVIKVVVPKTLDAEGRALIEQFATHDSTQPREGLW